MKASHLTRWITSTLVVLALFAVSGRAADPEPGKQPAKETDRAALEKKFEEMMSGVTLTGRYTSGKRDLANLKEDKYTIFKVSKLAGDTWIFSVRIQYGGKDYALPLPINVLWAGETPVLTLDKAIPLPGIGAFSCRIVIDEGKYAGTWSGADHGGHIFGTITKGAEEPPAKDGQPAQGKEGTPPQGSGK